MTLNSFIIDSSYEISSSKALSQRPSEAITIISLVFRLVMWLVVA